MSYLTTQPEAMDAAAAALGVINANSAAADAAAAGPTTSVVPAAANVATSGLPPVGVVSLCCERLGSIPIGSERCYCVVTKSEFVVAFREHLPTAGLGTTFGGRRHLLSLQRVGD